MSRDQYNEFADQYEKIADLPLLRLEHELVDVALASSSCAGARVFDLGGGSGVQARLAIAAGASVVDVVDISDEMLNVGKSEEVKAGRSGKINYYLGDAIQPLDHLGLQKHSYDIVIANWLFDHCSTLADLDGMWKNIADYAKPGARYVGIRNNDPLGKAARSGKYGAIHEDIKEIENGYTYQVTCKADPPIHFWNSVMKPTLYKSTEYDTKYGFENIKINCGEETKVVQEDSEFWAEYFEGPLMMMVTATKKK